jgi:hypothetical protein
MKPYAVPLHDKSKEKWIDLDGTQSVFLRLSFERSPGKKPVSEVNFFNI